MKKVLMKKFLFTGVILFAFIIVVQACSIERRRGNRFIHSRDSISVCIIDPLLLLKDNLKTFEIENYDSLPKNVQDSLLYFHSHFLQYVNDSLFLGLYTSNLKEYLATYGIRVYSQDSMNEFLASGGKAYMFNIAQIMLEEYLDPYAKSLSFDTNDYRWDFWLNTVALNVWYEASILNRNDSKMKVLYGNMFVRDKITGRFTGNIMTGDINYVYRMDTINMNSIYNLASKAASTHAQYIFDYILNDQIVQKTKPGEPSPAYMHYDPVKKKLRKAYKQRFTVMN
jgi:hypothetical protein